MSGQPQDLPIKSNLPKFLKYGQVRIIDRNYSSIAAFDALIGLEFLAFPSEFNLFHGSQSLAITGADYPIPGLPIPAYIPKKLRDAAMKETNIPIWFMGDYRAAAGYGNRPPSNEDLYELWYNLYWMSGGEKLVPSNKITYDKYDEIDIDTNAFFQGYTKIFAFTPKREIHLILITPENIKKFITVLIDPSIDLNRTWVKKMVKHLFGAFFNKHSYIIDRDDFWEIFNTIHEFDRRSQHYGDDLDFSEMMCELFQLLHKAKFPLDGYIAPPIGRFHAEIMVCDAQNLLNRNYNNPYDWRHGLNFDGILDSFRKYVNVDAMKCRGVHRGDLYEHSVWTMFWMNAIITQGAHLWFSWTWKQFGQDIFGFKNGLILAALYHDIGKGGGIKKMGERYDDHPRRGFEMMIGKRKYCRYNAGGEAFKKVNFEKLLEVNGVDSPIVAMFIAVSIGMHYKFGLDLVRVYVQHYPKSAERKSNGVAKLRPQIIQYLMEMRDYVSEYVAVKPIDLNPFDCRVFVPLIEFCVAVSTADVLGAQYYNQGDVAEIRGIPNPPTLYSHCPQVETFFKHNNWGDVGVKIKNYMVDLYTDDQCPMGAQASPVKVSVNA